MLSLCVSNEDLVSTNERTNIEMIVTSPVHNLAVQSLFCQITKFRVTQSRVDTKINAVTVYYSWQKWISLAAKKRKYNIFSQTGGQLLLDLVISY